MQTGQKRRAGLRGRAAPSLSQGHHPAGPGETSKVNHPLHHLLGEVLPGRGTTLDVSRPWWKAPCWGWARWLLAWLVALSCWDVPVPGVHSAEQQTCSSAEQMSVKSRMRRPDARTFPSGFFPSQLLSCDTQCVRTS